MLTQLQWESLGSWLGGVAASPPAGVFGLQDRDAQSLPTLSRAFSRGQGLQESSLLVRKAPVSAAVLSFGISPRTKLTGTAFPGTALCPQPSLQGKSQGFSGSGNLT